MPHVTTRKVFVTAQVTLPFVSLIISKLLLADVFMHVQDFSNLLGGGLVSFSTLSENTVQTCSAMGPGALICVYRYDPADVVTDSATAATDSSADEAVVPAATSAMSKEHFIYAICWRGATRTLNVMCGKTGTIVGFCQDLVFTSVEVTSHHIAFRCRN
jgi:hypothetical protein